MADLTETITTSAESPKRVQGDEGSAEAHSLPDLIEADRYLKAKTAAAKPHRGLRYTKAVPPGAV